MLSHYQSNFNMPSPVTYNNPKPMQSTRADIIISFMFSSVSKWTGKVIDRSHVEVVGLHLHPAGQPWRNLHWIFFENPRGGTLFDPVNHLSTFCTLKSGISVKQQNQLDMQNMYAMYCIFKFVYYNSLTFHMYTMYEVTEVHVCISFSVALHLLVTVQDLKVFQ